MKNLFLFILPLFCLSCEDDNDDTKNSKLVSEASIILDEVISECFNDLVDIERDSKTYKYLVELSEEALFQTEGDSKYDLPLLYIEKNFPSVYNYYTGNQYDKNAIYKTMIGWICAMQLSELCPDMRNVFYKVGYEAGGFSMKSNIYGYQFAGDPNVARLVASAIYAAMHTTRNPDLETMRKEVGGRKYNMSFAAILAQESRYHVTNDAFYVDLRRFMASAPGPYAPAYANRKGAPTFPDEKTANGCLKIDMDIYNYIVESFNLPNQRAVQAIADEEADMQHLFGTDKRNIGGKYDFNAVFGESTIGETINPEGVLAEFMTLVQEAGSAARGVLQHADASLGHYQYGRLRPGCSEQQECKRKSYTDDRLNVLTCFIIEDNDGHKVSYEEGGLEKYYYDENGNWTNVKVQSIEQYEDVAKDKLYANSYPSGHSSSIWSMALSMIELYPHKADLIMRAANDFAVSRTVARYHWNSDVIQGKIIGSIISPICHATSDYYSLLERARKEH